VIADTALAWGLRADLLTARLRARVRREMHTDCVTFTRRRGPVGVRLVRVQTHDDIAVLDLYSLRSRHYSAAVLVRERGGLRAFQFIPRAAPPSPPHGARRTPGTAAGPDDTLS